MSKFYKSNSKSAPISFIEFNKQDIEQSIANRFEQQVNKYPDSIAVKSRTQTLTYNQLNKAANRLARAILSQRGEGSEVIALLLEQGTRFVTAIFGVLKTGKIYVPIDPSIPVSRLTYIFEDSQSVLIVTNNKNLAIAQELAQDRYPLINIDDIDTSFSTDNLELAISPDTPASIIYTSGSTGKPKGVLQNHRNVLHNCMINTNALRISPDDRLTLLHSCGVMGAMRGICNALLNGASLYPLNVREEGLSNLINLLNQEEITIYHSVATLFRHFVSILPEGVEQFPKLRVLILGGEQVLRTDVELYKKYFSDNCIIYVSLGSTETGTARQFIVDKNTQISTSTVPIGYAVNDKEILLLDETGAEVSCGEIGEIAVKSKYLALGYWQKPEQTKAVFIPDPKEESKRIYRTGDLGRMSPDGCIVHMGRKDFQVKIRGFRIEINEIELALLGSGVVKEVVVVARDDEQADKRLVAYVVPNQKPAPTISELRRYLQKKLPEYMLPSAFVFLDALPLTPNGKIDRLALPVPDFAKQELEASFVAPRTDLERQLTQIWEEVLNIQSIGVRDNFFDLGGHSLLGARLFMQIEKKFGQKLPLATLLQSGTVEALAKIISDREELAATSQVLISEKTLTEDFLTASKRVKLKSCWSSLVAIQTKGSKPPLFCIHPLGGEILCYRDLAIHLGPDQPVYGLQPQGLDGTQPLCTQVEEMASHYIQEIQTIQPQGPYYLAGYSFGGIVAFEMAQQLHRQGEKVAFLVLIDTCRPGFSKRLSFLERVPLHLNYFLEKGLGYVWQKAIGFAGLAMFHIKHQYNQYRRYLKAAHHARHLMDIASPLDDADKYYQIIGANAQALSQYTFQVYPGRMTLLRTEDKNRDDATGVKYDPQFGWGDIVTGGLDIHYIPGSHLSILNEPHVRVVAEKLKLSLEKAYSMNLVTNVS